MVRAFMVYRGCSEGGLVAPRLCAWRYFVLPRGEASVDGGAPRQRPTRPPPPSPKRSIERARARTRTTLTSPPPKKQKHQQTTKQTGDCYRADHLLEAAIEAALEGRPINKPPPGGAAKKGAAAEPAPAPLTGAARQEAVDLLARVGELGCDALGDALARYGVLAPDTGNPVSRPFPFNLMFKTSIGPRGDLTGYLRPETAQGIFVNFRDLLYYNGGRLPFAAAQIGNSYRNEISPRAGLLRVREFTQAEIEHFVNPDDKRHPKFSSVAPLAPLLYARSHQMGASKKAEPIALGDAVERGLIANETLAYFIGRTWLFFTKAGVDPARMRFRQHLQHEMAHYAEDCWDAEVETTYGWVECAGLADRSAYDLTAHAGASGVDLSAHETFAEPRMVDAVVVAPSKKEIGVAFKKDAKAVCDALEALDEACALRLKGELEGPGAKGKVDVPGLGAVELTPAMASVARETKKVSGRRFVPSVIEPSFGIGRILYCIFEHAFYERPAEAPSAGGAAAAADGGGGPASKEAARTVFRFTPLVAPIKATVFPLLQRPALNARAQALSAALTREGLSSLVDTTGVSIGRRYARTDEIGVPFAITVDHQTVGGAAEAGGGGDGAAGGGGEGDGSVTVRERDSMAQVRVPGDEVARLLRRLVDGEVTWEEVAAKYPAQAAPADK